MAIDSLLFPFRRFEFKEHGQTVHVFHCIWEEHAPSKYFEHNPNASMLSLRFDAVLNGRRNLGQRSIQVLVRGYADANSAQAAVEKQLQKLIKVASTEQHRALFRKSSGVL
jgi:hypothetical protein